MTWPTIFGSLLGGNQPASLLDGMFNQTGAMIQIPCVATGTNAISLTPLLNCPALTTYNELGGYRFRASANSSGAVTAQYNGLGFLPVYHADGATQAGVGDIIVGRDYVLIYSGILVGGLPGFFLEQSGVGGSSGGIGGVPGGRLTLQSATPVMSSTQATPQTIFYAPYVNQFVPIWNGSTLQAYNFCASLADQVGLSLPMGGSASWPINSNFDVYVTLNSGVPVLATVQWTNQTTRATLLSVFGGMLTNATLATMRLGAASTISVPANQATFLGTFATAGTAGQSTWQYGASASGGGAAIFGLCNYYNKTLVTTLVIDNGAPYTYTAAATRPARNSTTNSITAVQSDSERSMIFSSTCFGLTAAANGAVMECGLGIATNAFLVFHLYQAPAASAINCSFVNTLVISATGLSSLYRLESSDGVHANTFSQQSGDELYGSIWL